MSTTKIVELFIEDEFENAGIDAISLVSAPAHDSNWLAFNKDKKHEEVEKLSPQYKVVDEDFCNHNPKLSSLGEPIGALESEGYEIIKMEKITPQMVFKMNQERFSKPNAESSLDNDKYRVRFKYVGPNDDLTRTFCRQMLSLGKVYRLEDINQLSDEVANPDFGFYEIFLWRGSFNCRHVWVRLLYKKTGTIVNDKDVDRGLIDKEKLGNNIQRDTRTKDTIDAANRGETKAGIPVDETQWEPGVARNSSNNNYFSNQTKKLMFFDEEKKTVVGAAMIPNKMIHRYDALGNLYYVFFSKASIKRMADKFLRQKRTDETSIEHDGQKLGSDKVYVTESWVSEDPIKDKSNKYGFELPAGTWFVSMKVDDPSIWKMIKDNVLTGFSVEGLFAEKSVFSTSTKK